MKSYKEQVQEVWAKEEKRAIAMGFKSVAEYREYLAVENRKKTYEAKIAHYEKAIAEMKKYLAEH